MRTSFSQKFKPSKFSMQKRDFTHRGVINRQFIPPKIRNLDLEFDVSKKTANEEHFENGGGEYISNSKVFKAKEKGSIRICYAKRYDYLESRVSSGQKQPDEDEAAFILYKEATADILMNMMLGQQQVAQIEIAKSTENGKPILWHLSYELKHYGTLKTLQEKAGMSARDFNASIFYPEHGRTYATMVDTEGLYGEKGKVYKVRVDKRIPLKGALMMICHQDVENHRNNIVMVAWYDPKAKEYVGVPAMFDFGNAFLCEDFKTEHGFKTTREAAIYQALNPLDDMIKDLHLNDKELVKRWPAKKVALENPLEISRESANQVFDWQESHTPQVYKEYARDCRRKWFSNYEVAEESVPIIQLLFDVAEAIFSGGKEVSIIKSNLDNHDNDLGGVVALLDRFIEVSVGITDDRPIKGKDGERYMEYLEMLAKNLGVEKRPYIPKNQRVEGRC